VFQCVNSKLKCISVCVDQYFFTEIIKSTRTGLFCHFCYLHLGVPPSFIYKSTTSSKRFRKTVLDEFLSYILFNNESDNYF